MRAQAGGWSEGDVRQGFDTRVRDSTVWICERSSYWSLVGPDEPLLSEERRSAAILERAKAPVRGQRLERWMGMG